MEVQTEEGTPPEEDVGDEESSDVSTPLPDASPAAARGPRKRKDTRTKCALPAQPDPPPRCPVAPQRLERAFPSS